MDRDERETPPEFFDAVQGATGDKIVVDVCATIRNAKCKWFFAIDGLEMDWAKRVEEGHVFMPNTKGGYAWMNPPYSYAMPWVDKAIRESKKGLVTVALLMGDSSTQLFKKCFKHGQIVFLQPRIRFLDENGDRMGSPEFPNILCIFGGKQTGKHELWEWKKYPEQYGVIFE